MTAPLPCGCDPDPEGYKCQEHRTRGVQVGDDLVIFGEPWPNWEPLFLRAHPGHPVPWLGGLDADEYARVLGRAS